MPPRPPRSPSSPRAPSPARAPRSRPGPTAHRPLLEPGRGRRGLSHVGGAVETSGDPDLARLLAAAFTVRAGERDATLTHPFHAYPARLHPEIARQLVAALPARGTLSVLDPFCGSGTVLVEALASGHRAVGTDLSPLAIELASLKTRRTTADERRAMVARARSVSREATLLVRERVRLPVPRGEAPWFAPPVLAEVAALAELTHRLRPGFERDALRMLLSSILVKVSRQASDSDARRVDNKPVAPGAALRFFAHKAVELDQCLAALASAVPPRTPEPTVRLDDATELATVPDASIDAVITSPPYANTYDYVTHHERRYAWLGLDARALASREVGAARWFKDPAAGAQRFARELHAFCTSLSRVLRPGALAFVVLADGAAGDRALPADEALALAARGTGLSPAARASQSRPAFDRTTARAFAQRPKREHLLALRKG